MKKFIFVLLLSLLSISSFANVEENNEILDAVMISLENNDLDCIESISGKEMKASTLQLKGVFSKEAETTINEDGQPVIVFTKKTATSSYRAEITSNMEMTTVIKVIAFNKNITTKRKRVNVGTLISPEFKEVVTTQEEISENISCN